MTLDTLLVFLDLETTGLHPTRDTILEIGICVVDGVSLQSTAYWSKNVEPPWAHPSGARLRLGGYVFDMHTKSGLLSELNDGYFVSLQEAERGACSFLAGLEIAYGSATIAGFCPQFDMAFLKEHMPTLAGWIDYRHVDVSTLRGLVRRWVGPQVDTYFPSASVRHRAIDDCLAALDELRFYRSFLDLDGLRKTLPEGSQ